MIMDEYSHLMDIDEVVEYLNKKTERDFDQKRVLKFIEERNIPIVFEYQGWVTWRFINEGKYQKHHKQLKGYFNIQNDIEAVLIFKGFLNKVSIERARIYRLNPLDINNNPINSLEPKEGDNISFETGGRSPLFGYQDHIEVENNKVGVLKADLEEYLNKKRIEPMENKTKMEALEPKNEKLKSENEKLKSENNILKQQLEKLTIANAKIKQQEQDINRLNDQLNSQADRPTDTNKKEGQGDSLLILGAVMHCIQDAAKKNYTQELLIQVILEKYKSVSGISEGTLKKKFPESKNYLNQKLTT